MHERFGEIGGGPLSSSIALATFLSLFPLLLVAIAVVGFVSVGQRRLHQRRHQRARAPGRGGRGGGERHRHRREQQAGGRRSSAWSACSGAASRWSAPCSPPSTPPGRSSGAACSTAPSRSAGSSRRASLFLVTAAARPGAQLAARRAGARQPRSSGLVLTTVLFCWTYSTLGNNTVGWRVHLPGCAGRGARLRDPQGRRRRVPAPPDRRVLRPLRLDRGGVRARSPGWRSTRRLIVYGAALNVVRYEATAGTVTVELEVPRIEGEVPLTATRGGAVDERAPSPIGPVTRVGRSDLLVPLPRACPVRADILVQRSGPTADATTDGDGPGRDEPCGHEHWHRSEWRRPRPLRSPGCGRSAPGRPGGPAVATAPTPTPSTAPPASAPASTGAPVRITWIGDSLAAGLGCDDVADTPAHLAARLLERPVDVTMLAVPGSKASDVIEDQLDHVDPSTELVVLCVGANDVATSVSRGVYARAGRSHPHRAGAHSCGDAHAARHLDGRPDGRAAAQPGRRPWPLLRGRSRQGRRAVTTTSCRSTSPAVRRASTAAPVAGCCRPTASIRAPRATELWAERIATACSDILDPPRSPFHPSMYA